MLLLLLACGEAPPDPEMVPVQGPAGSFWIDRFEAPNVEGAVPVHGVDLASAVAGCAAQGKRLCTAGEWREACRGSSRHRFPYGDVHVPGRCYANVPLESGHTSVSDAARWLAPGGAFPDCVSDWGVYDLVGNVEEWVLDDWRTLPGNLEGGAWYTFWSYADCTGSYSRQPDYRLTTTRPVHSAGYRCCWSASAPNAEAIGLDARERLEEARPRHGGAAYDPSPEVAVAPGLFIDQWEFPNVPGARPLAGVSWTQADRLCREGGKRLCTAAEWELACHEGSRRTWPYGVAWQAGACGVELEAAPAAGSFPHCVTSGGTADLVGGVWEWTATVLERADLKERPQDVLREVRGGAYTSDREKGRCDASFGYPAAPEHATFPDVGFRCCRGGREPAPAVASVVTRCPEGTAAAGAECIEVWEAGAGVDGVPRGGLDLDGARALCAARGRHLCPAETWLTACEGPGRRWPYGDVYAPGACNDDARGPRGEEGGVLLPAGARSRCVTPEGVYDLSGNLWEWVAEGQVLGGDWNFSAGMNQCRSSASPSPDFRAPSFGARCCAAPLP